MITIDYDFIFIHHCNNIISGYDENSVFNNCMHKVIQPRLIKAHYSVMAHLATAKTLFSQQYTTVSKT